MNNKQKLLLELARTANLSTISLRDLAKQIGVNHPQVVQYHLDQLVKNGFLFLDRKKGVQKITTPKELVDSHFIKFPIFGFASCGPADRIAEENVEGFITVQSKLVKKFGKKIHDLFALRASGDSMTQANIEVIGGNGKAGIQDGDIVIVNPNFLWDGSSEKYVVCSVDNLANIKRIKRTEYGTRLVSESENNYPPIVVSDDFQATINGEVIGVIPA